MGVFTWSRRLPIPSSISPSDAIRLVQESFAFIASYEGEIPGAREEECGNYREQNLPGARHEAAAMLSVLKEWKADQLNYPAYL